MKRITKDLNVLLFIAVTSNPTPKAEISILILFIVCCRNLPKSLKTLTIATLTYITLRIKSFQIDLEGALLEIIVIMLQQSSRSNKFRLRDRVRLSCKRCRRAPRVIIWVRFAGPARKQARNTSFRGKSSCFSSLKTLRTSSRWKCNSRQICWSSIRMITSALTPV